MKKQRVNLKNSETPANWRRERPAETYTAGDSKIKEQPTEQPIVTVKTCKRYGISAGFDPRYQCDPAARPEGAGFMSDWNKLRGVTA